MQHNKLHHLVAGHQGQAAQDMWVALMHQQRPRGQFLELGAGHPRQGSNTWLLEKNLGWSGWSIDLQDRSREKNLGWSGRSIDLQDRSRDLPWSEHRPLTRFVQADAHALTWHHLPPSMGYLSMDLDDHLAQVQLLRRILAHCQFGTITFEHDLWRGTESCRRARAESRLLLQDLGYHMVANDVTVEPGRGQGLGDEPIYFEDWWAHPAQIPQPQIARYQLVTAELRPKYWREILLPRQPAGRLDIVSPPFRDGPL